METITAFKTSDGRIFDNESLAHAHELGQRYNEQMVEFFSGHCSYRGDTAQGSIIRRAIVEWEMFKKIKEAGDGNR